jgi:hypothetical protein
MPGYHGIVGAHDLALRPRVKRLTLRLYIIAKLRKAV